MIRKALTFAFLAAAAMSPAVADARSLNAEIWTDRGSDAVYQPGERVQIKARSTEDAYLLVYDIDAEGSVHVLFPAHGQTAFASGRQTLRIPADPTSGELVVQGPVGQGYIVVIASRDPLRELPAYLRPYDPQGEGVGYVGEPDDEDGVTRDGRIVGDPFVAMERIRRRVLDDPDDRDGFATAYVSYYVHDRVRYPRYVCYDCHRPNRWAWWDGFDPYYASCSAVDFRVNWSWAWGPGYWFGAVPYYVYVVRPDCPPYFRPRAGYCYSSWDGWGRWNTLWGTHLVRHRTPPPPGYLPPVRYKRERRGPEDRPTPPGFLSSTVERVRPGGPRAPLTREPIAQVVPRDDWRPGGELRRPAVTRAPMGEVSRGEGRGSALGGERPPRVTPAPRNEPPVTPGALGRPRPQRDPAAFETPPVRAPRGEVEPAVRPRREESPRRYEPPRQESPRAEEPQRVERPRREEPPRVEKPRAGDPPRVERPRAEDPPRVERPRREEGPRREAPPRAERPRRETPPRDSKDKSGEKP